MPEIKLYDFHGHDLQYQIEIEDADTGSYSVKKTKKFTIEMYGLDEEGTSYKVSTTFKPWFCVKLNGIRNYGELIAELKKKVKEREIKNYLKPKMWDKDCDCFANGESKHTCGKFEDMVEALKLGKGEEKWNKSLSPEVKKAKRRIDNIEFTIESEFNMEKTKPIRKCKLYGFDNFKKHEFMRLSFNTVNMMNKFKGLWYTQDNDFRKRELKKFKFQGRELELYEATLPPLLRYFHEYEINPSGWIKIKDDAECLDEVEKTTTQDYEYDIDDPKEIKQIEGKEAAVPYKQMCWDIEASSSHGDFPLAVKGWDKLIKEMIDWWKKKEMSKETFSNKKEAIKNMMNEAILQEGSNRVSKLYLKEEYNEEKLNKLLKRLDTKWVSFIGMIDREDIDGLCCDGTIKDNWGKFKKKGLTTKYPFPKVEGDKITFIGSTFQKYGQKTQYLNHIVSLGECDDIPEVENREIISCETEEELLITWAEMIKKENPEMMIGYNTAGFDWKFIIQRTQELGISEKFLKLLSKNMNQNTKSMIKKKEIKIASGTHQSTFIEMNGRVQLDLYSYYRKEENLPSYKLDYVSSYFIGDSVKKFEVNEGITKIISKNLMGIKNGDYISFEILGNSTDMYMNGKKFIVKNVDYKEGTFEIDHVIEIKDSKLRWCLNKDDITLEEMFNGDTPEKRAKIAKYCFQDCNLLHNLMRKCDILTGLIEFSAICKIPLSFAIDRGQGIKLLSFIAYQCIKFNMLMPTLKKAESGNGYEGAIVLPPKVGFYADEPVAVNDYSSLYPSCMVSENISHDSKVWTKEYNLENILIKDWGEKDQSGNYIYDNLKGYKYVDVKYDTYKYIRKTLKGAEVKVLSGYKICRYIQFNDDKKGIMPSVLTELLAARKATKKLKAQAKDPFMKSVYDKRQLGIKVVANSLYGQCGARTSAFYDVDIAASTTATGRKLLLYAKRIVEDCYDNVEVETKFGKMNAKAEYVYGDTDSVFFKFNLTDNDGNQVRGKKALEVTIQLAKEAGVLATKFLKLPHDLEYEKTFMPFLLLSKKKYVGMLYEEDVNKCKRKDMGIVLKRRDNAPCVKDSYGGVVDILMSKCDANSAVKFIKNYLDDMINEKIPMNKLIITKKLNAYYKNPNQIAHKVLADRMGERDPGNKPSVGSRLPFVYIKTKKKVKLQGDKIEHPDYIKKMKLKPDYEHYITNQIMKPLLQLFGLLLEDLKIFRKQKRMYRMKINSIKRQFKDDKKRCQDKITKESDKRIKKLIFDEYINTYRNNCMGQKSINSFFKKCK